MYREGACGWVVTKARIVTNSMCIRDNIDNMIAGRHWMKTVDNKWMVDAVEKGIKQESEMTIMGIDNEAFGAEELETRQYWDDLSGKELDARLVKKARLEEMKEVNKHEVYVKVPIEECWANTGMI